MRVRSNHRSNLIHQAALIQSARNADSGSATAAWRAGKYVFVGDEVFSANPRPTEGGGVVSLGRAYGTMLGQRYCEVRYEDLVRDIDGEMGRLLGWLGMERLASPLDWPPVNTASVGKWRKHPATEVDAAMAILEPTLTLMGYSAGGEVPKFDPVLARRRMFWS